jgi:hypothetical protein
MALAQMLYMEGKAPLGVGFKGIKPAWGSLVHPIGLLSVKTIVFFFIPNSHKTHPEASFHETHQIIEISANSPCLHPVFGPPFTPLTPLLEVSVK